MSGPDDQQNNSEGRDASNSFSKSDEPEEQCALTLDELVSKTITQGYFDFDIVRAVRLREKVDREANIVPTNATHTTEKYVQKMHKELETRRQEGLSKLLPDKGSLPQLTRKYIIAPDLRLDLDQLLTLLVVAAGLSSLSRGEFFTYISERMAPNFTVRNYARNIGRNEDWTNSDKFPSLHQV
ncbi:hypothetical protein HOE41_00375 [Candidatus Woesearchaeota archaeon]|nr:hypothetical protein [Candidatus Woesearchaeota archaeon]